MNLAQVLKIEIGSGAKVILVGIPEVTTTLDSNDKPYYVAKLATPIIVRCSMDPNILPFEADEIYVREEAINSDDWVFVDETKPELGFYKPNWIVDFSQSQEIPIYQSESIKKWASGNREARNLERKTNINAGIKARIEARKGK